MANNRHWFMNTEDKINLDNGFCPAHRLLHTFPFVGELIRDESCHYHESGFRMVHHKVFCKLINCFHYEQMMRIYTERKR